MECLICHKHFKNAGVHIKRKHMDCNDYRRMFNISLTTPLADPELCELFSVSALQRLKDPEWLAKCAERCARNSLSIKGTKTGPLDLPPISKKRLIEMNRQTGASFRLKMIPAITADYLAGSTPTEIRRKHGVSQQTLKDWQKMGFLPRRLLKYEFA